MAQAASNNISKLLVLETVLELLLTKEDVSHIPIEQRYYHDEGRHVGPQGGHFSIIGTEVDEHGGVLAGKEKEAGFADLATQEVDWADASVLENVKSFGGTITENGEFLEAPDNIKEQVGFEDDEEDAQWEAYALNSRDHDAATDQGWGGESPDLEDFDLEGKAVVEKDYAHNIKEYAQTQQDKHKIPLVNDLGEPEDDIYDFHDLRDEDSITLKHLKDYITAKTGAKLLPTKGEIDDIVQAGSKDNPYLAINFKSWQEKINNIKTTEDYVNYLDNQEFHNLKEADKTLFQEVVAPLEYETILRIIGPATTEEPQPIKFRRKVLGIKGGEGVVNSILENESDLGVLQPIIQYVSNHKIEDLYHKLEPHLEDIGYGYVMNLTTRIITSLGNKSPLLVRLAEKNTFAFPSISLHAHRSLFNELDKIDVPEHYKTTLKDRKYALSFLSEDILDGFNRTGNLPPLEAFGNEFKELISQASDEASINPSTNLVKVVDELYHNTDLGWFHSRSKHEWETSSSSDFAGLLKDSVGRVYDNGVVFHNNETRSERILSKINGIYEKYVNLVDRDIVDKYVKTHKQLTGTLLDMMYPHKDTFTLFRGVTSSELTNELKGDTYYKPINARQNPLSSWSITENVAEDNFARSEPDGVVFTADIHKDNIWSFFASHAYDGNEREFLVISKPETKHQAKAVEYADYYDEDEDDYDDLEEIDE